MNETKTIGEEKKITAGKIGESVWGVVKICILIYCAVGMFIRMTNETLFSGDIESAYSAVQEARMSNLEASVELEKYSGYGYSEAQLAIIEQDLKDGIDVSKYAQKGQSLDEFISARESVIESYDESYNRLEELHWKYGARFVISGILCGICMLWTLLEKVDRTEKYELS